MKRPNTRPRPASTVGRALLIALLGGPALPAQLGVPDGGAPLKAALQEDTEQAQSQRTGPRVEGLDLQLSYTVDVLSNVSGGVSKDTAFLGNVDLLLTADMEQLLGWRGGTLFVYGLGTHGDSIGDAVGDLQSVSNIEAHDAFHIFEAWYEWALPGERASLLAGLFDVNSEFDVIPAGGLFMNSSHGIGSEFGNSGINGPSTFPVTSLALRMELWPTDTLYLRTVIADGVPGAPGDPRRTGISLDTDDGLLIVTEVGWYGPPSRRLGERAADGTSKFPSPESRGGYSGKYALGLWGYTTEFDDFIHLDPSGNPEQNRGTYGAYALAERSLFDESADPTQGLSAFARIGFAEDRASTFDSYAGGGLVYHGPLSGRDEDQLGLAVALGHLGDDFRRAASQGGEDFESWEIALELTYRATITPRLSIQPDVQYVINPGGDPELDDALVLGARIVVSF